MDRDFSKYKKQLEDYLIELDFIYSGDIIKSELLKTSKLLQHSSHSTIFISEIISEVYNLSIKKMIDKSKEVVIDKNLFKDVYDLMNSMEFDPKILFYSQNSNLNLNLGGQLESDKSGHFLPNYFNRRFKLMTLGKNVSAYFSPLIEDFEDDCHFYLADSPIQSMCWSLQNMTYEITNDKNGFRHSVDIPVYDCDYNVYKIRVVDTQKIRQEKINTLLDGN